MGEYDAAGNVIEEHVWLGDTPIAMLAGPTAPTGMSAGNPYYVFADQIDTPKALADGTGKVVWKWEGEGFGSIPPNEDVDGDGIKVSYNLRYPGQVYDRESGLFYNWFRYYDPTTGRYVSSDPIGLDGGSLSTYAYVNGNPISRLDPKGLFDGFPSPGDLPARQVAGLPPEPTGPIEVCCDTEKVQECQRDATDDSSLSIDILECLGSKFRNKQACTQAGAGAIKAAVCMAKACKIVPAGTCKHEEPCSDKK